MHPHGCVVAQQRLHGGQPVTYQRQPHRPGETVAVLVEGLLRVERWVYVKEPDLVRPEHLGLAERLQGVESVADDEHVRLRTELARADWLNLQRLREPPVARLQPLV